MLSSLLRIVILCFCLTSVTAFANTIEAFGEAIIYDDDLISAREEATRNAIQRASMHASVYVSSNQVVEDGLIEVDNLNLSSSGLLSNIEVIEESIRDNLIKVKIRALVSPQGSCPNGISNKYVKTIAVASFPLMNPGHASLGALNGIEQSFPSQIARKITQDRNVTALNASQILLFSNLQQAGTTQLDDGTLTSMISSLGELEVNYVVSGVIRDLTMADPSTYGNKNYFKDLYNRYYIKRYKPESRKYLRNFVADIYIHDGFSGQLIHQKTYNTVGLWNVEPHFRTGYDTAAFYELDYGQQVNALQDALIKDLSEFLRCEPFSVSISRTNDRTLWINAGERHGIKRGDKLTVYRRSTFFDPSMTPSTQLSNTKQTLVIDDVQMNFASGHINNTASSHNIRPGDLVIAR